MALSYCRILVTGANGFIGKNLVVRLSELANVTVSTFVRGNDIAQLAQLVSEVDAVVWQALGSRAGGESVTMPR